MAKLITFGETILRLQSQDGTLFLFNDQSTYYLGGSELNIAVFAQNLGLESALASLIPNNTLGERLLKAFEKTKINTSFLQQVDGPLATYFMEKGDGLRGDQVLARQMGTLGLNANYEFDWPRALQGASYFHSSGITAGLSAHTRSQLQQAMQTAKEINAQVSYDFNFRSNIWSFDQAKELQKPLLENVDVLFLGGDEITSMLGGPDGDDSEIQKFLFDHYPFSQVIRSQRTEDNQYTLTLYSRGDVNKSKAYPLGKTDRIGAGDAMTAAFLFGQSQGWEPIDIIDFAAFCACLKQTLRGDFMAFDLKEVTTFRDRFHEKGYWR